MESQSLPTPHTGPLQTILPSAAYLLPCSSSSSWSPTQLGEESMEHMMPPAPAWQHSSSSSSSPGSRPKIEAIATATVVAWLGGDWRQAHAPFSLPPGAGPQQELKLQGEVKQHGSRQQGGTVQGNEHVGWRTDAQGYKHQGRGRW